MAHGDHPGRDTLRQFLARQLDVSQMAAVFKHLLAGCEACSGELGELFRPPQGSYGFAVAQALAASRDRTAPLRRARSAIRTAFSRTASPAAPGARSRPHLDWAWCELLLEMAEESRATNLQAALDFALLAALKADRLGGPFLLADLADLRARAWAELGNLERAADDLAGAESSLGIALDHLQAGSGDPLLFARLLDIHGSLYRDQRRFLEAARALDRASHLYLANGERHRAGRALITKGVALIHAEQPDQALEALDQALDYLNRNEPKAILAAVHNVLLALTDSGRHELASRLLWSCRPLYQAHAAPLDRVRLLGLEAKVAAGLGQAARAERLFREEKAGFEAAGLAYDAALVGLDLAGLLLEQGRPAEVLGLVDEMLGRFEQRGILREACACYLVLRRAVETGGATAALVRSLAADLKNLDRGPADR